MPYLSRIRSDEVLTLALAGLFTGWSWLHLLSIKDQPMQESSAWLLIEPLVWFLTAVTVPVAISILWRVRKRQGAPNDRADSRGSHHPQRGRLAPAQCAYLASLPVFYMALEAIGYTVAAALYVVAMPLLLGERRLAPVAVLVVVALVTIHIGAAELLSVPLPLLPWGSRG